MNLENAYALAASCEDEAVGPALAALDQTAFVSQGEGGEQGDGSMSWLYGCAQMPVMSDVMDEMRRQCGGRPVVGGSYQDNKWFIIPVDMVDVCISILVQNFGEALH